MCCATLELGICRKRYDLRCLVRCLTSVLMKEAVFRDNDIIVSL